MMVVYTTDHADRNAAVVIKKRAINLILHPGTGLSSRGVLVLAKPSDDTGRGERCKTSAGNPAGAMFDEPSKEKAKRQRIIAVA